MEKPNVIDKRHVKLEEIMKENFIPFLGGRPERSTIIQHDEIVNLSILLNTSRTIEELINHV